MVLAQTQCRVAADARTNIQQTMVDSTSRSRLLMDASKSDKHKNPVALVPKMVTLMKLTKDIFFMGMSFIVQAILRRNRYFFGEWPFRILALSIIS